jgi:hypothetical protein
MNLKDYSTSQLEVILYNIVESTHHQRLSLITGIKNELANRAIAEYEPYETDLWAPASLRVRLSYLPIQTLKDWIASFGEVGLVPPGILYEVTIEKEQKASEAYLEQLLKDMSE